MLRKYRRVFFRNEWIKNTIKLMQERLKQGVESSTSRTIHYLLKVCDPFSPPRKFFPFPRPTNRIFRILLSTIPPLISPYYIYDFKLLHL